MRIRFVLLVLAVLSSLACASRPQTPGRPEVTLLQQGDLLFGNAGRTDVHVDVAVRNVAAVPIVVRRVRLNAGPGMQYRVSPAERTVHREIASGETGIVSLTMEAFTDESQLDPTEPLMLRAMVEFERDGKRFREIYTARPIRQ